MPGPKVYLVGSVHYDLNGPERLKRVLELHRPDVIGVEDTQENIAELMRQSRGREIAKAITSIAEPWKELIRLKLYTLQRYETWVSYEFQRENQFARICPLYDKETLDAIYKAITKGKDVASEIENTLDGLVEEFQTDGKEIFQRKMNADYDETSAPESLEIAKMMDDSLEKGARNIMSDEGTVFIIAGVSHFFADYPNNLYRRLIDFSPIRVKLSDF